MAYATEYLLGNAAYAFVSGITARSGLPAEYWTKAVGFRPDTLDWFSEHNVSALDTAPRHLRLQATVEGSGVLVSGPEWNNLVQVSDGLWAGWGAAPALRFGQDVAKATTDLKDADATARSASPERYGIFFKGHTAKRFGWLELGPYRHATLRAIVDWSQFETLAPGRQDCPAPHAFRRHGQPSVIVSPANPSPGRARQPGDAQGAGRASVAASTPARPPAFHADVCVLAQPRRALLCLLTAKALKRGPHTSLPDPAGARRMRLL